MAEEAVGVMEVAVAAMAEEAMAEEAVAVVEVTEVRDQNEPAAGASPEKWGSPLSQQPGKEHVTNLRPNLCNGLPMWSVSIPADSIAGTTTRDFPAAGTGAEESPATAARPYAVPAAGAW